MRIGYARVPRNSENISEQIKLLESLGCFKVYSEELYGVRGHESTQLDAALTELKAGDTLVICSLSRMGRSFFHTIDLINELFARGVNLLSITEGIDTSSPTKYSFGEFFVLCRNLEDQFVEERHKVAQHSLDEGRRSIYPSTLKKMKQARELWGTEKLSIPEVAERLKVAEGTVYAWFRRLKEIGE